MVILSGNLQKLPKVVPAVRKRARLINIIDHKKIMSGMLKTIRRKERLGTSTSPEFLSGFCT
jgi:hypothetical protein